MHSHSSGILFMVQRIFGAKPNALFPTYYFFSFLPVYSLFCCVIYLLRDFAYKQPLTTTTAPHLYSPWRPNYPPTHPSTHPRRSRETPRETLTHKPPISHPIWFIISHHRWTPQIWPAKKINPPHCMSGSHSSEIDKNQIFKLGSLSLHEKVSFSVRNYLLSS